MIKKWIINGDLHGEFKRLEYLRHETPNETAIVCLGDFGGYYYLNNNETSIRRKLEKYHTFIYFVFLN